MTKSTTSSIDDSDYFEYLYKINKTYRFGRVKISCQTFSMFDFEHLVSINNSSSWNRISVFQWPKSISVKSMASQSPSPWSRREIRRKTKRNKRMELETSASLNSQFYICMKWHQQLILLWMELRYSSRAQHLWNIHWIWQTSAHQVDTSGSSM